MLSVIGVSALQDNYFWLVQPDPQEPQAYILDPGEAGAVLAALAEHRLIPAAILITHHHHDHVDGIVRLKKEFPRLPLYGPDNPAIPLLDHTLAGGESLQLGQLKLDVLALPGHTPDHIGYLSRSNSGPWQLFSGDTLFSAGCGRLLGGTAPDLHRTLQRLAELPDDTLVYASHEYTLSNLRFALAVEPDNEEALAYQARVQQLRSQGQPSLPTRLGTEKRINPFLRAHLPQIRASVERQTGRNLATSLEVFTALRQWKDHFSS